MNSQIIPFSNVARAVPLFTLALFVVALLAHRPVSAQSYPDKPVRIIVPWGTGGSTDNLARVLAQRLGATMGQSVIVENKPGAAAAIGTEAMAKAAPDGYTVGIIELPHAIAPSVVAKLPYDLQRDLQPVLLLGTSPLMLFTSSALPAKSVSELVAAAKAKPGTITLAHSGNGSSSHLAAELLQQKTGAQFILTGYKGSGPAMLDIVGGHVQGHFATMASGVGHVKTGKANVLGLASAKRLSIMKEVPTLNESGVPDFVMEQWWGVVVPKGTPANVIEKIKLEFESAMNHTSVQEKMRDLAIEPRVLGPGAFGSFVDAEVKKWAAVVKTAGIKPE
jgi:tripartite-type tricarboxylate transporter receptor subunit TctC